MRKICLLLLSGFLGISISCGPSSEPTPPSSTQVGAKLEARISTRHCPDQLAASTQFAFQGQPGQPDSLPETDDAKGGCVPKSVPFGVSQASSEFLSDCNKPEILCVGVGQEVKTLTEAVKQAQSDSKIAHIKIANGVYAESPLFENIQQELLIEGQSNDPKTGALVQAPAPTSPTPNDHAAFSVVGLQRVTLKRFALTGKGHGLWIKNVQTIRIEMLNSSENIRTGVTVLSCGQVEIIGARFWRNGSQQGGESVKEARFGVVIQGSKNVLLRGVSIAQNGAGGLLVSGSEIGVIVNNDYHVGGSDSTSVIVNNDYRVGVEGSHIHHNGPLGWSPAASPGKSCPATGCAAGSIPPCCPSGTFCENKACHPLLSTRHQNQDIYLGVGAIIAGIGKVELRGNSFYGNDVTGLFVHSAANITLQQNAFERNGVRPTANSKNLSLFNESAANLWNVTSKLEILDNLLVDNAGTGIRLHHLPAQNATAPQIALDVKGNHISGNGRFVRASNISEGDGLLVITDPNRPSVTFVGSGNYFTNNGRTGLFLAGAVSGEISGNVLDKHLFPAVILRDIGPSSSQIALRQNSINGARRYGIQVFQGAGNLSISGNQIENLQTVSSGTTESDADSIILQGLQQGNVKIESNRLENTSTQGRSGILVDNSKVEVAKNTIKGSQFNIVGQNGAQITGSDATLAQTPAQPLSTQKPEDIRGK